MYVKRTSNKAKKLEEFKKRKKLPKDAKIGIDKNGKEYLYNGDITRPMAPIYNVPLDAKQKELRQKLIEFFPEVFNEQEPKPLAKKIHLEIKEKLKELGVPFTSKPFFMVMKHWCGTLAYKKGLITNTHRIDIRGNHVEIIEDQEKADALQAIQFYIQQFNWKQSKEDEKKKKRERWLEKQKNKSNI